MNKFFQRNVWFIASQSLVVLLVVLLLCPSGQAIQKEKKSSPSTPILWRDPGEVERLDFAGGVAGRAGAPKMDHRVCSTEHPDNVVAVHRRTGLRGTLVEPRDSVPKNP